MVAGSNNLLQQDQSNPGEGNRNKMDMVLSEKQGQTKPAPAPHQVIVSSSIPPQQQQHQAAAAKKEVGKEGDPPKAGHFTRSRRPRRAPLKGDEVRETELGKVCFLSDGLVLVDPLIVVLAALLLVCQLDAGSLYLQFDEVLASVDCER